MHPLVFIYEANSSDADLAATMVRAIMESKRLANEDDLLTWLIESMYLAIKWNFLTAAMNDILPELRKLDHGDSHRIFADGLQYGWTGQQPSSGFCDLAPSILHYNWF
jgi:hypothetical protein